MRNETVYILVCKQYSKRRLAVYITEHLSFNRFDEINLGLDLEAIWFKLSQPK